MKKKFLSEELLIQLIKDLPNDSELGYHIRKEYWEYQKRLEQERDSDDVKIYESPDKGKTIYVRNAGDDVSQRKIINQIKSKNETDNNTPNKEK